MKNPSKRVLIILLLLVTELVFVRCNPDGSETDKGDEKSHVDTVKIKSSDIDSLTSNDANLENTFDKSPSHLLLSMVQYLDSIGYGCDTKFICEKKSIDPCICEISLRKHPMEDTIYKYRAGYDHIDPKTIKRELLRKVIVIHAFHYSIKIKGKDINPDGVIEEWIYQDEALAEQAGQEWNRIRNFVFYHTASYVCRVKNRLYIFHNRAAFDQIHRQTIKRFKSEFNIAYPATLPNAPQ